MVNVPVIDMHEPVVSRPILFEPGDQPGIDIIGGLKVAWKLVSETLSEASEIPPGKVSLPESGEADGFPSGCLKEAHPHGPRGIMCVPLPCVTHLAGWAIMTGYSIVDTKSPGKQGRPAGQTWRI